MDDKMRGALVDVFNGQLEYSSRIFARLLLLSNLLVDKGIISQVELETYLNEEAVLLPDGFGNWDALNWKQEKRRDILFEIEELSDRLQELQDELEGLE